VGSLKSTTPSVVSSTLAKLTTVKQEELLVKCKYKEAAIVVISLYYGGLLLGVMRMYCKS